MVAVSPSQVPPLRVAVAVKLAPLPDPDDEIPQLTGMLVVTDGSSINNSRHSAIPEGLLMYKLFRKKYSVEILKILIEFFTVHASF